MRKRAPVFILILVAVMFIVGYLGFRSIDSNDGKVATLPPPTASTESSPLPPTRLAPPTNKPGQAAPYKGWVRINGGTPVSENDTSFVTWNTETGNLAQRSESPRGIELSFRDFTAGEQTEYASTFGMIYRGALGGPIYQPPVREDWLNAPVTFEALQQTLQAAFGKEAVRVEEYGKRGLHFYDIKLVVPDSLRSDVQLMRFWDYPVPVTVGVEPQTNLISEITLASGKRLTFAYNAPAITSIYDLDAPRTAKVHDNRPTAETVVVYDRIMAHATKPFPDGVVARLSEDDHSTDLQIYSQAGERWLLRQYQPGGTQPQTGLPQMPAHWQDADADGFFTLLATTVPVWEYQGDGKNYWTRSFDKQTGEPFSTVSDATGRQAARIPGAIQHTGRAAQQMAAGMFPQNWFTPTEAMLSRFSTAAPLEAITSPDRPGLIALRTLEYDFRSAKTVENVLQTTEEWFDPAHNDRPVEFITIDPKKTDRLRRHFDDYETLPGPDGRSYPTSETDVEELAGPDGQFHAATPVARTSTHFFPGKILPPVPAATPVPPAHAPAGG